MLPERRAGSAASLGETALVFAFAPHSTSSRAGGSLTMVISTSAFAAASRGERTSVAPAATSSFARDAVRFQTVRGYPAFNKFMPIGRPIKPRPIKPIFALLLEGDSTAASSIGLQWLRGSGAASLPEIRTRIVADDASRIARRTRVEVFFPSELGVAAQAAEVPIAL